MKTRLIEFLKFVLELYEAPNYRRMSYQNYLHTQHWKQLKDLKLSEVDFRCQVCYSDKKLRVHHRTYERLGNERLTDLTVLCDTCHTLFHEHGVLTKPPKKGTIK